MDEPEIATNDDIRRSIRGTEMQLGTTFQQWKKWAETDDFPDVMTRIAWYTYSGCEDLL